MSIRLSLQLKPHCRKSVCWNACIDQDGETISQRPRKCLPDETCSRNLEQYIRDFVQRFNMTAHAYYLCCTEWPYHTKLAHWMHELWDIQEQGLSPILNAGNEWREDTGSFGCQISDLTKKHQDDIFYFILKGPSTKQSTPFSTSGLLYFWNDQRIKSCVLQHTYQI